MPDSPETARASAPAALDAEGLRLRVAELEARIADERAQASAKAREVERAMQILRSTMQELQEEVRRGTQERDRLREESARLHGQLATARESLVEMTARPPEPPPAPLPDPRVPQLERQLDESRIAATSLRERVAVLEALVRQRERDLVEARDAVSALEGKVASLAARREPGPVAPPPATVPDECTGLFEESRRPPAPTPAPPPAPPVGGAGDEPAPQAPFAEALEATPPAEETLPAPAEGAAAEASPLPEIPGIRIEQCVEEGPTGRIYDGREVATRRAVTVLLLPGILRLLEGGKLDSLLLARHPNLVAVLAFGVCAAGPYLVTERSDGESGEAWVRRIGPLPERTVLAVALEAARGLRQAASSGAVHGDLSPSSVLVDATGRVRIHGAGLRPVLRPDEGAPVFPEYAAPERLAGASEPDTRSDVYSLGAVLWFLLTGSPPPHDADGPARGAAAGAALDVHACRDDVSEDTARLLRKMLAHDPEQRHRTWDQLLIDLEHRQPGVVTPGLRGNFEARARRVFADRPWLLLLVIAVPFLAAFALHLAIHRDTTPDERWDEAKRRAEGLLESGDVEGARQIYRRFLQGVGDADIESEAARRFESLRR